MDWSIIANVVVAISWLVIVVLAGVVARRWATLRRAVADNVILREKLEIANGQALHWRQVVESVPMSILIVDVDLTIIYISNPAPAYRDTQVIGTKVTDYIHPKTREKFLERFDAVFNRGESVEAPSDVVLPNGDLRLYSSRYVPLLQGGKVVSTLIISHDVTHQKQLDDLRERFIESVVAAQEDERRRIARELHDGIGQSLTSMLVSLRIIQDTTDPQAVIEKREQLKALMRSTLDELRVLARGLHPVVLDELGLAAALDRYRRDFCQTSGVQVDMHLQGVEQGRLTPSVELTLYRIVQEALHNVAKHAEAKVVSIVVTRRADGISMIIEDDGVGFDAQLDPYRTQSGLGLLGVHERAALLNGQVTIDSSPGCGTTLNVFIPVSQE